MCDENFYTKESVRVTPTQTIPYNDFIKGPEKTIKVSEAVVVALPLCRDFLDNACPDEDLAEGYDPVYENSTVDNDLQIVEFLCLTYLGIFGGLANNPPS